MINRLLSLLNYGLKRINSSHFIRNVTVVGGGIAAAQATTFAFTPLLTRLYWPGVRYGGGVFCDRKYRDTISITGLCKCDRNARK